MIKNIQYLTQRNNCSWLKGVCDALFSHKLKARSNDFNKLDRLELLTILAEAKFRYPSLKNSSNCNKLTEKLNSTSFIEPDDLKGLRNIFYSTMVNTHGSSGLTNMGWKSKALKHMEAKTLFNKFSQAKELDPILHEFKTFSIVEIKGKNGSTLTLAEFNSALQEIQRIIKK